uniref:Uncharacterized protein n=1 Tax=Acrobeloides nanus TaxID=290746 RepID=A0A914DVB4_9BILA
MAQILEKNSNNSNLRLSFLSSDLIKNSYSILLSRKIIALKGSHDLRINTSELLKIKEKLYTYSNNLETADTVLIHSRL